MVFRRIKIIGRLAHRSLKRKLAGKRREKENHKTPKPKPVDPAIKFAIMQISFQSAYFPELTGVHNRLIKQRDFHHGTKALKITGDLENDTRLMRNMGRMMALETGINRLRLRAKNAIRHERDALIDRATRLESRFNGLKAENFRIFAKVYGQK